ncbi:UBN2 multi-domain protein [Pyrenophora tritici-repentis]|uniref:UBN2 multi-domain protein n=1 Tax=Pyrenophora tritici-repentis TaxID=45151 RepID=A0A834SIF4_9PLEO|nr:UBN2 multi-domain protein [Pyrenophora tritici-repentis]
MAAEKEEWKIPQLTAENHDTWFRRNKVKLKGKKVFYVCEKNLVQHCQIATASRLTEAMEELEIAETDKHTKIRVNIEKRDKYLEDEATAIDLLFRSLSEDDQALIDEYDTAFQFWAYLQKKYTQTDATTANIYMTRIQTFTFNPGNTIVGSWEKLKDYRRKLVAADADTNGAYKDSALLLVLIRSLPKEFKTTIDTLNAQLNLTVEQKLKFLEEKEVRDQQDANEKALPAFRKTEKYVPPYRRRNHKNSPLSSDSESGAKFTVQCFLCDGAHGVRDCPRRERARKLLKEYDAKKSSKLLVKTPKQRNSHKRTGKAYGAEEVNSESDELSETSDSEPEEIETCRLSKDIVGKASPSTWAADTGASSHMSDQPSLFRRMIKIKRRVVRVGGGELYADWKGEAQVVCKDGSSTWLSEVLLVPNLGVNLLSGRRICAASLKGRFNSHALYFKLGKKVIIEATMDDGLYVVSHIADGYQETAFLGTELHAPVKSELKVNEKERYLLYHRRFAHLGPAKIAKLHEVTTLQKKIQVPEKIEICEVCSLTKMKNSIPKQLREHKATKLALVQFDIAGPFPTSLRGNRWFLLIIDSYTRKNWVIPLKKKGDAQRELQIWKTFVEHQTGEKVKAAGTDNAPELLQQAEEWRVTQGVEIQPTTIASSHQNGPAERNIQTAEADMRAMLKDAGLPIEFWDEAVEADAYLRNRTNTGPTINGKQVSPEEAFTGTKPSIDHIRVWGSKCYSYINPKTIPADQRHDKLVDRGRVGVFMGYSETTNKQFKFYSPELGYTSRTSRLSVDEYTPGGKVELRLRNIPAGPQGTQNTMPDRKPRGRPRKDLESSPAEPMEPPPAKSMELSPAEPIEPSPVELMEPSPVELMEPSPVEPMEPSPAEIVEPVPENPIELSSAELTPEPVKRHRGRPGKLTTIPPTAPSDERVPNLVDEEGPEEPYTQSVREEEAPRYFTRQAKRKRSNEEVVEDERFSKIVKAMLAQAGLIEEQTRLSEKAFAATEIAGIQIPQTHEQAINDPKYGKQWKAAILEEIIALMENRTWEEVPKPKDANMVDSKWVFTVKTNLDGTVERFKARLVARVRMDTLRLFMATVAAENLECFHFDIKNAFTESHLKEEIFLKQPQGVEVKKGYVLKVLRSLYGLKQAARDWNLLIKKELLAWGFVQSLADPCMFIHEEKQLRILVYVDDIAVAAKDRAQIDWFYKKLSGRFNTKNLGEIHKILGVRVTRDRKRRTIYLDQEQYIHAVLDKFGMSSKQHRDKKIPSADYTSFRPATNNDTRIDITEYQQVIGSLMFAMVLTRPDIAFTLGKLSQYMSDPAEHHGHALKNLLRYLRSTVTMKLRYGPGGVHSQFVIYSDADWASDMVDRKSVSGSTAMFYGGPISWSSKKQRSVATSSCESEYIALSTCCKQGQWIAQMFRDLGFPKYIGKDTNKVQMLGDNQGAIALTKNPHLHERSKHIDVCYHFIRDLAEQGKLDVAYVPTVDMVADGMTKPLQRVAFEKFKNQLGVVLRPDLP